ncbi:MAG: PTS transporter subunit EIIB [Erysipelotrichales bacterium]|nr:PTS transporter subunit EIIB [Erysipelotrichales bacterium]
MFLESEFANFFKNYGFYIALALVILIAVIATFLLVRNYKKRKNGKNTLVGLLNDIIEALGGKENINSMEAKMSRLNVSLISDNIDIEKLKAIGIERVIKMSNKITLLVGNSASEIANEFNK